MDALIVGLIVGVAAAAIWMIYTNHKDRQLEKERAKRRLEILLEKKQMTEVMVAAARQQVSRRPLQYSYSSTRSRTSSSGGFDMDRVTDSSSSCSDSSSGSDGGSCGGGD